MQRPARVYSRDELIDAVHDDDDPGIIDRTVDVHLGRLRRKLGDDAAAPRFIETVRSVGLPLRAAGRAPGAGGRAVRSLRTQITLVLVLGSLLAAGVVVLAVQLVQHGARCPSC